MINQRNKQTSSFIRNVPKVVSMEERERERDRYNLHTQIQSLTSLTGALIHCQFQSEGYLPPLLDNLSTSWLLSEWQTTWLSWLEKLLHYIFSGRRLIFFLLAQFTLFIFTVSCLHRCNILFWNPWQIGLQKALICHDVTYWLPAELSDEKCSSVNNRCIRSKISEDNLDCRRVELSANVTLVRGRWMSNYYITPGTGSSDQLERRCWNENHVTAEAGPQAPGWAVQENGKEMLL